MLYEVRATSKRVVYPITLVEVSQLSSHTGFRSLYGYSPEVAGLILRQGGTFDLDGWPLYSDTLFIDFDNADAAAHRCAEALRKYNFEFYHTGGRGYHLHVKIAPMFDANVPAAQKAWVKARFPEADWNIYKSSGVIRLPGTFHARHPGQFKQLLYHNPGEVLKLDIPKPKTRPLVQLPTCTEAEYVKELNQILDNLLYKVVREGTCGRNGHAFKIACVCRDLGKPPEEALELVESWNSACCLPPLKSVEFLGTINSAYKRRRQA